jgi:hypothetical protein
VVVGFDEEAADGGLQLDERGEHAALELASGQLGDRP